ncbi:unnamed protein product [Rhizoctonia solani]|uniref:Uncharacterized protein n=1 Tax=Rhizoctonia solani TaxID=456999 RepID=A0A8H2XG88_9AGAM|nr:unnamed protein product [Rhizoctonia solani]
MTPGSQSTLANADGDSRSQPLPVPEGDLTEEWSTAVAGAGVMWASNMVFVASPSVDIITKTACGISAIATGATGISTLHMIREHRSLGKYAANVANYFQLYENRTTGLRGVRPDRAATVEGRQHHLLSEGYTEGRVEYIHPAEGKLRGVTETIRHPDQSAGSGCATLKSLGRKTLDGLKRVVDSTGVVPGLSHLLGALEKLQNEFEDHEARFLRHLDALSSIIEPCLGGASHTPKGANASPNNNLMELHSTIGSVRDALCGHTPAGKPHSRILDAKEHQRRFEEATDSFRNWTNEWIVRSVTNLEQKFEGLEGRMRNLDSRAHGLASVIQGFVVR